MVCSVRIYIWDVHSCTWTAAKVKVRDEILCYMCESKWSKIQTKITIIRSMFENLRMHLAHIMPYVSILCYLHLNIWKHMQKTRKIAYAEWFSIDKIALKCSKFTEYMPQVGIWTAHWWHQFEFLDVEKYYILCPF